MLSIYNSEYTSPEEMKEAYDMPPIPTTGFYYPPEFIHLTPIQFTERDEYQPFLIPIGNNKPVQHFTVIIRRISHMVRHNKDVMFDHHQLYDYYSMGFSFGPHHKYVLGSPDFYLYHIHHMEHYQFVALQPFTRLGPLAHKLNQLLQGYNHGGFHIYKYRSAGYFALPNVHLKYTLLRRTCLTGFDSVFPIPTKCLHRGERLSYYLSTGKTIKKRKRKRIKKTHRAL